MDRSNLLGDWHDINGVGLFNTADGTLYLATNNGLYSKHQNSTWVQVGNDKSDITGFVINPKKNGVMYSSGYPPTGGNLGFRMSTDSGNTWKAISSVTGKSSVKTVSLLTGINPIAFNSIWSAKTAIPSKIKIKSIAAHPSDPNNVFIGTNSGIF